MDRSVSFQLLSPGIGYSDFMIQTETISLKKSKYNCFEDNSMIFKDCINDFISEQIKCQLPWAKQTTNFSVCKTEEDLKSFRNLSIHIRKKDNKHKIDERGCFKHNCKRTTWIKNQYIERWVDGNNDTSIYLSILSSSKVVIRKEILLADYSTFIADCGSYLGLFVGASVLSLTDTFVAYFKRLYNSLLTRISMKKSPVRSI